MKPPSIAVVGSINMDLVIAVESLPKAGETVAAHHLEEVCGGKGANQAVAAGRAGGAVRMIGRVGDDVFANRLVENLRVNDIDCEAVTQSRNCASGLAVIGVESSGQNQIMIVAGANAEVSPDDVLRHESIIAAAEVLLLQLETPVSSVLAAIEVARKHGVRCMLDPAPVVSQWTDDLLDVDLVCPNETEATAITGMDASTIPGAEAAARELHQRGAKHVVITLGEHGCILLEDGTVDHIESTPVTAVDTTAAGDAFAGALAVHWSQSKDLREAARYASIAGALAATRHGAQPSLPSHQEIEAFRSQDV